MSGRVHYVGIGEMKVGTAGSDAIVAPNLGSCLAIAAYDPSARVGGMVHCLLPDSALDEDRARSEPGKFVDTGFDLLLESVSLLGASRSRLILVAVGGSAIGDPKGVFEIGKKNFRALAGRLERSMLELYAIDIGGAHSRTLQLLFASGEIWLRTQESRTRLYPR